MKKCITLILIILLIISLTSCINNNNSNIDIDLPVHEHKFSSKIIKESTIDENGIIRYTCDECNYFYEEKLPLLEHTHTYSTTYSYDETYHYYESTCGHDVVSGKEEHIYNSIILKQPTLANTGKVKYECEKCGYSYEDVLDKISNVIITHYNSGLETLDICLFDNTINESSLDGYYKIYIKCIGGYYYVTKVCTVSSAPTEFDYIIAVKNVKDNNNITLLNELGFRAGNFVVFSQDINTITDNEVNITITKDTTERSLNVEYDLGFDNYQTKDDLYEAFFGDFYDFLINYTTCDMSVYEIEDKDDFLVFCKTWEYNGRSEMGGLGDAFSKYYLTNDKTNSGISNQPTSTFLGYCYSQGKYLDLIEFFPVFFAYWRTDEGYTKPDNHGNEFYYSSWAAFVDTCKYFYFTSDSITDTYKWYTKQKSARVHYVLDHVPNVSSLDLVTTAKFGSTIELPDVYRMGYTFLGWYTEKDGGTRVTSVNESMKVYARFERTMHNINYYVDDVLYTTIQVKDGQCIEKSNIPVPYIEQYQFIDWSLSDGKKYDLLNAVYTDINFYANMTYVGDGTYSTTINGYNTQRVTSEFGDYEGLFIIQNGEKIDATKFWIKIAIKYINEQYVVTDVKYSGEAMPTDYDYIIMSYKDETSGKYQSLLDASINIGMKVEFDKDLTTLSNGSVNLIVIFKN